MNMYTLIDLAAGLGEGLSLGVLLGGLNVGDLVGVRPERRLEALALEL